MSETMPPTPIRYEAVFDSDGHVFEVSMMKPLAQSDIQVLVKGSIVQPFSAELVAMNGGEAVLVNEDGARVGTVYVKRVADKPDGTPQYGITVMYEYAP